MKNFSYFLNSNYVFHIFSLAPPDLFLLSTAGAGITRGSPCPWEASTGKRGRGNSLGAAVGSRVRAVKEKEVASPAQAPCLLTPEHPALIIIIRGLMRIC